MSKIPDVRKKTQKTATTCVEDTLKIALISTPVITVFPPSYGGLELVVGNLGKELAKLGHKVTIFAPNGSSVEGCDVVETGDPKDLCVGKWLDAEASMYEAIQDQLGNFDVIHGHNWMGQEYRAKAKNPALKVMHTHHGAILADWAKNRPFKLNNVAISDWMKSVYEKQGIPSRKIYNGVNMEAYPLQKQKGDRFLWLSRIAFFKAPHRAIGLARKTGIRLDIVGATCFPEDAKYIEQIEKSCDGDQIRFLGEVSNEEKIKLMQNARGFLVTGKWGEPFGLHVVEAMATGTTVVAIRDGALSETIKEGGILCDDLYDTESYLKNYAHKNPEVCRRNAEEFSAERMASTYVSAYRDVMAGAEW